MDLQTLQMITQKYPAIKLACEILVRDHVKLLSLKTGGSIEIRITYDHGIPTALEDMGREKHSFK